MKLIDNAKHVFLRAWSVRWMLLANLLGAIPILIDGLEAYVSPKSFVKLMIAANVAALIARFIKQDIPGAKDA